MKIKIEFVFYCFTINEYVLAGTLVSAVLNFKILLKYLHPNFMASSF